MFKYNVMAFGFKCSGAFCHRRFINFHHPVSGHLGDKHLRNKGQALVKGSIDPCNDQQEKKKQHKINGTGQDQIGSHKDGGGYPHAHDHTGSIDKKAGSQFPADHHPLMFINLLVQAFQIPLFLICGTDLPDIFQCLLNAV